MNIQHLTTGLGVSSYDWMSGLWICHTKLFNRRFGHTGLQLVEAEVVEIMHAKPSLQSHKQPASEIRSDIESQCCQIKMYIALQRRITGDAVARRTRSASRSLGVRPCSAA